MARVTKTFISLIKPIKSTLNLTPPPTNAQFSADFKRKLIIGWIEERFTYHCILPKLNLRNATFSFKKLALSVKLRSNVQQFYLVEAEALVWQREQRERC